MSAFLTPLVVVEVDDSVFALYKPFIYQSDLAKRTFTIPINFRTDFASVPRLGILYAMLGDRAHEPALVHDFLYASALTTRKMADDILMEAMDVLKLPFWQKWPIYWGVRVGGWYAWNQHRKQGDFKGG